MTTKKLEIRKQVNAAIGSIILALKSAVGLCSTDEEADMIDDCFYDLTELQRKILNRVDALEKNDE